MKVCCVINEAYRCCHKAVSCSPSFKGWGTSVFFLTERSQTSDLWDVREGPLYFLLSWLTAPPKVVSWFYAIATSHSLHEHYKCALYLLLKATAVHYSLLTGSALCKAVTSDREWDGLFPEMRPLASWVTVAECQLCSCGIHRRQRRRRRQCQHPWPRVRLREHGPHCRVWHQLLLLSSKGGTILEEG